MILEIANPSDKATIDCTNLLAAQLAVLIIGNGKYGIIDNAGENGMPPFILGGVDVVSAYNSAAWALGLGREHVPEVFTSKPPLSTA